ncbi:uncharacterized protein LOC124663662 [Lolium rigidum]|uniref:uncharacterized protein LOC124663662 n=1 Tax=Lolium rigidum TaxID=89674 RepID=UPI001F5C96FF|nr:uncharacterized protein LOC124663662 [Lolium rigidum]
MAKTSTLVVVISITGGAGFSRVVDMALRGAELMEREAVKGSAAGVVKVQDRGMEAELVRLPGIPSAVILAAEMLVVLLVSPAVKVFRMKIGVLALNRFGATVHGGGARGGIDAELLKQTVHEVVAAVTAAQKKPVAEEGAQVNTTILSEAGAAARDAVVSVATPTVGQQQDVVAQQAGSDPKNTTSKGKEDEGQGPSKKKKEEKNGCFRSKMENPRLAKVTVDGDAMTIPEIIEQMKKIVPHEKFNWEVFHFKDNIYRVKLPSKLEVQRLKNFGTYICTDRESCLSFDLWRGFFKLKFEVENAQGSQEETMVEASNDNDGNDGNDDAKDGNGKNGDDNAMDMDPKKNEAGDTSSARGTGGSIGTNEGERMQEQIEHFDAIQIGSMSVQLSPKVSMPGGSVLGSPPVRSRNQRAEVVSHGCSSVPASLMEQRGQSKAGLSVLATSGDAAGGTRSCAADRDRSPFGQPATDARANGEGKKAACGLQQLAPCVSVGHARVEAGSSVDGGFEQTVPGQSFSPQRIRQSCSEGPRLTAQYPGTQDHMIATDWPSLEIPGRSSVGANAVANGLPKDIKEGVGNNVMRNVSMEHGVGLTSMGIASSPKPNEEVIAFGGIPKPSTELRSSSRLGGQSNADIPLLEKAMKNAQLQDDSLKTRGILVGINSDTLQVSKVSTGDFCVKMHIKCKRDGFEWVLVPVYGAAQDMHKAEFLSELVRTCESETLPMLVGGDFNIIRTREEKNNANFKARWPFVFNAIIEHLNLREISLTGRQFTWASRREKPTYEKLDRVLASISWEQKFPLVTVRALTRADSDHTPILIDSGRLDLKAETTLLNTNEREEFKKANDSLNKLRREEESKWAQRAKVKHIQEGGNNTRYFHLIANGKHRKKKIFQLEQQEGTIVGDDNLKVYITEFYKKLFGAPASTNISLVENDFQDITQISPLENEILTAPFTEKEVFEAVSQMELNKAPGPDGFPAEFYQKFWDVIKKDLMALFSQFSNGDLPLYKLNFGVITLLPKKENAVQIQQYRPICLLNVCFKIFTKVGTNRISGIAPRVIKPTQSAFMPGRNILEGVVILHETIHELHTKKLDGVLFKIDFEKAYDKVKWPFLQQTLRMKGFDPEWGRAVQQFVQGGSVGVKVNDDIGHYFQTKKGLRQGDPLSPMLFNIVVDMLAILIERAKGDGQVGGLIPHLVEGGLSILQYADDTILFLEHDLDKAVNMKLILCIFEELSGLKINFHKSEIFCFGKAKEEEDQYRHIFGCDAGQLPFRYLGIPIHYKKLKNSDWYPVETRFESKLGCWKGKLLSYGDRLVLINSVLTSLPMFMLSFLRIPVGVRKRLDFYRSRFFWQSDENKKKYRLTKWNIVCRPKDQGGLGIEVLEIKNRCLLSKWLFKLLNENGVWQELLHNKYLAHKTLSQVEAKPTDSPFWKGLMEVKHEFFQRGSFKVGNGMAIRFWEDTC